MRLRFILLGIGPVIALFLVRPAPASAQRPGGYRVTPVPDGATLTGRVTYDGAIPRARRLMITKDVEVCGFGYRERQEI
ncbi:MAG: hypothetical protein GWO22_16645, partial [Actinobacteria bacterium]|nr:hypothetical protein [Actinomycetota bacterium]NIR44645.1 hypothetical protein [Gemmatimonadota bacterium]NIW75830.1 hypothetical protein [Gemmatimonadota bacterium]